MTLTATQVQIIQKYTLMLKDAISTSANPEQYEINYLISSFSECKDQEEILISLDDFIEKCNQAKLSKMSPFLQTLLGSILENMEKEFSEDIRANVLYLSTSTQDIDTVTDLTLEQRKHLNTCITKLESVYKKSKLNSDNISLNVLNLLRDKISLSEILTLLNKYVALLQLQPNPQLTALEQIQYESILKNCIKHLTPPNKGKSIRLRKADINKTTFSNLEPSTPTKVPLQENLVDNQGTPVESPNYLFEDLSNLIISKINELKNEVCKIVEDSINTLPNISNHELFIEQQIYFINKKSKLSTYSYKILNEISKLTNSLLNYEIFISGVSIDGKYKKTDKKISKLVKYLELLNISSDKIITENKECSKEFYKYIGCNCLNICLRATNHLENL